MSKLDEVLEARVASRARLLELKRELVDKERLCARLEDELGAAGQLIKREKAKLIELTQECGRLLHADLAGVAGKDVSSQDGVLAPALVLLEKLTELREAAERCITNDLCNCSNAHANLRAVLAKVKP